MKLSIQDFFSKCDQIRTADLVTFTEEILNGKLYFLGSERRIIYINLKCAISDFFGI